MEDVPWLSPPQLRAWMRFVAVVELLPGVLDSQLQRDADVSHFEYYVLAMLSEAPNATLRMTALSLKTNATLPRLSHVIKRLESRGLVRRAPCPEDRRATNASLTEEGIVLVVATAPGHVRTVRENVINRLTEEQIGQLDAISDQLLRRLDPDNRMNPPA
ncbi:MAG: MarR family transcriptional regulator [Burkholderiaceae bacterium]|nr:MarR family transcriptional regulator [Microbacteriaceae bacterium]